MRPSIVRGIALAAALTGAMAASGQEVYVLDSYQGGDWYFVSPPPFAPVGVDGDNKQGAIVFGGRDSRQVAYINQYRSGSWSVLPDAPFPIRQIAGGNKLGGGVLIANGRRVAYVNDYARATWRELPPAPFDIKVLTGDNHNGPAILGTDGVSFAHLDDYARPGWRQEGSAPFPLQLMSGDNRNGVVGMSGRRLAVLDRYGGPWRVVAEAPFDVVALAGDNRKGAAGISADGRTAVIEDYRRGWRVLPQACPLSPIALGGDNQDGLIVVGSRAAAPPPPPPPPPPPADRSPPSVTISNVGGGVCTTNSFTVDVQATDNVGVTGVRINGVNASPAGGNLWRAAISLAAGNNQINAEAFDGAGNVGRASATLFADWTPPQISASAEMTVTIRGRVDDPQASVTVNGQAVSVNRDGTFAVQVPNRGGSVEVVAVDRAGNRTVQQIPLR